MIHAFDINIVLVANELPVAKISEAWLLRNRVFAEGDAVDGAFFTPMASRLPTAHFDMLVLPNRVQFSGKDSVSDDSASQLQLPLGPIRAAALAFLEAIPREWFRVSAVGLNTAFVMTDESGKDFHRRGEVFFSERALSTLSKLENSQLGFSASSIWEDGIDLNLEVKPISGENAAHAPHEGYSAAFNFNCNTESKDVVVAMIQKMDRCLIYARELAGEIDSSLAAQKVSETIP